GAAQEEVKRSGDLAVPLHLRNAPTKLMKEMGYGSEYRYSHTEPGDQEFLPEAISGKRFYEPGDNAREQDYKANIERIFGERYRK
ncbi:MAG: replication-associated recombination protein A, partial [Flavobacteriales bacterium]|nr:replication-associated recombination protein A [Flavobacteriales bacterium]